MTLGRPLARVQVTPWGREWPCSQAWWVQRAPGKRSARPSSELLLREASVTVHGCRAGRLWVRTAGALPELGPACSPLRRALCTGCLATLQGPSTLLSPTAQTEPG